MPTLGGVPNESRMTQMYERGQAIAIAGWSIPWKELSYSRGTSNHAKRVAGNRVGFPESLGRLDDGGGAPVGATIRAVLEPRTEDP